MTMTEQGRVERMIEAIERADLDAFAVLFAADAVLHHPLVQGPLVGRAAIRESEQALFEAFSDISIQVVSLLAQKGAASCEVVLRARNTGPIELEPGEVMPATQRVIEVPAAWFFRYDEHGLVVLERDYFDTAVLMNQLQG